MKVLMQARVELFDTGGGDKIQIENTARELKKLGIDVEIVAGNVSNYNSYDLVHLFQLDWTPDPSMYAETIKSSGKPLVFSPIHHSISEVKLFDETYAFDFRRLSKAVFKDQFKRDTLKNVYKSLFMPKKIYPTVQSLRFGLFNIQKKALSLSDYILVQTELEAHDLKTSYGVDFKWKKIPNGVSDLFIDSAGYDKEQIMPKALQDMEDYILCVGRVEARKNQLSIIDAVKSAREETGKDLRLVFVGKKSKLKHQEYIIRFNLALKRYSWITFVNQVPYEQMPAVYRKAKVCVSASWFETTGLTSIEALFCGSNAVASGERAREYLGDLVSYCSPNHIKSIKNAVVEQYFADRRKVPSFMLREYTWQNAAHKIFDVYNELLK